MNKKSRIFISLSLIITTISTVFAFSVTNLNATHHILNSNSNLSTNLSTYSDNDSSMLMNNNQAKAASDADFLLNSDNAISLANPVEMQTSTSVTNGPRGFLSQVGRDIVYTGYDGKIIWSVTAGQLVGTQVETRLISSHYNAYANSFVILFAASNSIRICSITEDGKYHAAIRPTFLPSDVNNYKRHLLVPIYETDNIAVKAYYIIRQYQGETKHVLHYSINNAGTIALIKSGVPDNFTRSQNIWLAAGSINYGGNTYTAILYLGSDGDLMISIYKDFFI